MEYAAAADFEDSLETGVPRKTLDLIAQKITTLPEDLVFFNKTIKLVEDRAKMVSENRIDWALGELFAYGSLVLEEPLR